MPHRLTASRVTGETIRAMLVRLGVKWQRAKDWITEHNRQVRQTGTGVRIVSCPSPVKSPWLNPIEPKWVHGKRKVVEPDRLLAARELAERVCAGFGCAYEPHLALPEKVS